MISLTVGGCAAAPPAPPADTSSVSTVSSAKKKTASKETDETTTATDTTSTPTAAYLGANVGDDDTKKAVTDCNKTKKFFDRAGASPGVCSKHKLAEMECTIEGIKGTFSGDTDKKAFTDMLTLEKYTGFLADQCIDCKGSTEDFCKKEGVVINGLKILFVKEEADVIKLQYMIKQ